MQHVDEILAQLANFTGVKDIACHRIANGKLNPVLKTETDQLGIERWKQVHGEKPVYISEDPLLTSILKERKTVIIDDVATDPRSHEEFFFFGIDSLMIVPVIRGEEVEGLLIAASIGSRFAFTPEQAAEGERLAALL
ncbi:acetolactate synthase-1/2/3 large subunit [Paenibacillaceae bacterium GAS479]|nr:acetolactate synthase-1/2/3 large subunit [Paenibacillaceae bacterium GAS479]